nr:MAG TPA: hypothetical protein [Caudoviricetes sp.]
MLLAKKNYTFTQCYIFTRIILTLFVFFFNHIIKLIKTLFLKKRDKLGIKNILKQL